MGSRPSPFEGENQSFPPSRSVAIVVSLVGVSECGHYTAQTQESLLNSGATNKVVFITEKLRSGNECVAMVTS